MTTKENISKYFFITKGSSAGYINKSYIKDTLTHYTNRTTNFPFRRVYYLELFSTTFQQQG